ncbi:MAG: ClpXP protease specificity-enhancing factor [Pseudomonadales bacterium]|nr:ClpXP protease specificity-enhancing factor [Pseudomonadales bacterium]
MTPLNPYLIRSVYEWILDNDCTPHMLVDATADQVEVPQEYVQDGQIVLNMAPGAVQELNMDNDSVSFQCRFGGVSFPVFLPTHSILGVYARENGRGMMLQVEEGKKDAPDPPEPPKGSGSHLKLVD